MALDTPPTGAQPPENPAAPEKKGAPWLDSFAKLTTGRVRATVLGLLLGAGAGAAALAGLVHHKQETTLSDSEKPVDPERDPILASNQHGDWEFSLYRTEQRQITNEHGNTLYGFIKGLLLQQGLLQNLDPADHQPFIEAYIDFIRKQNPQEANLDDFKSLNTKTLTFPQYVLAKPHFSEALSKENQGYERVQNMAMVDGFPVKDTDQQQAIYNKALRATVEIPASPYYNFKDDGTDDSPRRLEADILPRLEKMGQIFKQKTGYTLYVTDVLRDPALNAQTKGSSKGTTHTTGRSFDLANGRFNDPNGTMITWSVEGAPGPNAQKIDNTLQPALTAAALEAGFLLFKEGTHWHIYAPKNHILDLSKAPAPKSVELITRPQAQGTLQVALNNAVQKTAERTQGSNAVQRLKALDALVQAAVGNGNSDRFHSALCTDDPSTDADNFCLYDNPSEELLAPYASKTLDQIQAELNQMPAADPNYKNLLRVRNQRLRLELIQIIRGMTDEEIVANNIFDGSVVRRMGDIKAAWRYKKEQKGGETVDKYYPFVEKGLEENSTLSMKDWYDQQHEALSYFKKHAAELGYSQSWINYLSPSLMLSVLHAEFFSEFSAETYLELLPVLFSAHHLHLGPALNDHEFSGGLVQMIASTFKNLLNQHGDTIKALQASDSSYTVVVPEIKTYQKSVTRFKKIKGKKSKVTETQSVQEYDREAMVDAMLLKSQYFYNVLAVISHIAPGMEAALADAQFREAWNRASEQDRSEWLGSFSAMSINAGPAGAKGIVEVLLQDINTDSLKEYTDGLPQACQKKYTSGKGRTTSRGARRGRETMEALISRAESTDSSLVGRLVAMLGEEETTTTEMPVATPAAPTLALGPAPTIPAPSAVPTTAPTPPTLVTLIRRVPLLKDTEALMEAALADGFQLSDRDPAVNQATYDAAAQRAITVPNSQYYYRKADQKSPARLDPEAAAMLEYLGHRLQLAAGATLAFTETLQSPEDRAEITRDVGSTSYTGRWLTLADGRFQNSDGTEITWSVPGKKGRPEKGPDAGAVEARREVLVRILEEEQARGNLLALEAKNGGYQIYFPKAEKEEQEDSKPNP